MITTTKRVGASEEVGIMAVQTRLKLYETTMIPSILYNIEACAKLADKEIKELEKIQHSVLVQLLELPTSTSYIGMLMELGMWTMEARMHYRKLMLYHRITHSDDSRNVKQLVAIQKKYLRPAINQIIYRDG